MVLLYDFQLEVLYLYGYYDMKIMCLMMDRITVNNFLCIDTKISNQKRTLYY